MFLFHFLIKIKVISSLALILFFMELVKLPEAKIKKQDKPRYSSPYNYEITIPKLVTHNGEFVSYEILKKRKRRDLDVQFNMQSDRKLNYQLSAYGKKFHLDLLKNTKLLAPDFSIEYMQTGNSTSRRHDHLDFCHYVGVIKKEENSRVAISNCNGLYGVLITQEEEFFIEPLKNISLFNLSEGFPHLIYKKSTVENMNNSNKKYGLCGVRDNPLKPLRIDENFTNFTIYDKKTGQTYSHKRKKRSQSQPKIITASSEEYFVETLVVADKKMVEYYGKEKIEPYVLTLMNIVSQLYHDESLGNLVNIVVSRLIVMQSEQQAKIQISQDADASLKSFCTWQQGINPDQDSAEQSNDGVAHHDNAILLSRFDLCTVGICDTLGLAPVTSMCEPGKSCSIVEDIGLASAFTIAHEMGHNFGMQHDSYGNVCDESANLMAARMKSSTDPFSWSFCSKNYITSFLDAGRGWCLRNEPKRKEIESLSRLPGEEHNANDQCQLQHGPQSAPCKKSEICQSLWCATGGYCLTNNMPAAEGTSCSTSEILNGWCIQGECVIRGFRPQGIHGGWGDWSDWRQCTRSCGGGVMETERACDNPRPAHGGGYCTGIKKRFRMCNTQVCPRNTKDFRAEQCSKYDSQPFQGILYEWKPYTSPLLRECTLTCLAVGTSWFAERAPQVIDGTRCNKDSLDVCIHGQCRHVGCDGILESNIIEDKCRVCGGDGSSCKTKNGTIQKQLPSGGYHELFTIPANSVHINISETNISSKNYLALKSAVTEEYYLNGQWKIDWPKKFEVAGVKFKYNRDDNIPESLTSLGPITEAIVVVILLQHEHLELDYTYNVPVKHSLGEKGIISTWHTTQFSECSVTCAGGISKQEIICIRTDDQSTIDHSFCDLASKPVARQQPCNTQPCPAKWDVGNWTECSKSCGSGIKTRNVQCVQKIVSIGEEMVPEFECALHKPSNLLSCSEEACPPDWVAEKWSQCMSQCGAGHKTRQVTCMSSDRSIFFLDEKCHLASKPVSRISCNNRACPPPSWVIGEWSKCTVDCGHGQKYRAVVCKDYKGKLSYNCASRKRPAQVEACEIPCAPAPSSDDKVCEDVQKVAYCPLVLKFKFCERDYFKKICCATCTKLANAEALEHSNKNNGAKNKKNRKSRS